MPFIVIFGIRRKACRLATVFTVCGLCRTPAAQAVTRLRAFFSVFFVPVIPLGDRYSTTCTMCGRSTSITREVAHALAAGAQAQAAPPAPLPPPAPAWGAPPPPTTATPPLPAPESAQPNHGGPPLA